MATHSSRHRDARYRSPTGRRRHRHPVNSALLDDAPFQSRLADAVVGFMGSWRFIVIQTLVVSAWIAGNVVLLLDFDPFPFILLNLAFSTQAAYAAPLILLATNRASARDRLTLEHAATQSDVEEQQNEELLDRSRQQSRQIAALATQVARLERALRARQDRGPSPFLVREPHR